MVQTYIEGSVGRHQERRPVLGVVVVVRLGGQDSLLQIGVGRYQLRKPLEPLVGLNDSAAIKMLLE
jgi:hypothetical protein